MHLYFVYSKVFQLIILDLGCSISKIYCSLSFNLSILQRIMNHTFLKNQNNYYVDFSYFAKFVKFVTYTFPKSTADSLVNMRQEQTCYFSHILKVTDRFF